MRGAMVYFRCVREGGGGPKINQSKINQTKVVG